MKKVAIEIFVLSKKHFVCIQVHAEIKVNIFKCFTVQLLPVGQILVTWFVKINDQVPVSLERSNNRRTQKRLLFFFQDRGFDTFTNNMIIKIQYSFPANGREGHVTWLFPCFSVCRPPFLREEDIFSRLEKTQKREYLQPICSAYFFTLIACFYSYASCVILLPHVLFVKP